jgi:malate/lactate dehydrogenase
MNFTIIGFGEVGSLVGALINGRFSDSSITIFDFPEEISGRILDFKHACACNNNTVFLNDKNKLNEADFIIYTAGQCNNIGESRYSVAQGNKDLVKSIFTSLDVNQKTKVIVVTNPVEPVSLWIQAILKQKNLVIGTGTSLDTARLLSLLAAHFNCEVNEISTLVIGEHGDWMIPLFSRTIIRGIPITDLVSNDQLLKFEKELKLAARNIRKTENATKYGVAEICIQLILKLMSTEARLDCISVPISGNLKKEFGIQKDIFVSLPVNLSKTGFSYFDFQLNHKEKQEFNAALHSILSAP